MNKINPENIRKHLQSFDFSKLFIEELGWEKPQSGAAKLGGVAAREVARLGGIPALEIERDEIPGGVERKEIHAAISKVAHENLLVFVDEARSQTLWLWAKREKGRTVYREHFYAKGQTGDLFLSKLAALFVDFGEYESGALSVLTAGRKLQDALDVARVSKKFYLDFKEIREPVAQYVHGLPDAKAQARYVSILLNRLMFIYFLQKKGFLNNDVAYLENALGAARSEKRSYYATFLRALFFQGFARPERSAELRALIGKIPYLNGGLFLEDVPQHFGRELIVFRVGIGPVVEIPRIAPEQIENRLEGFVFVGRDPGEIRLVPAAGAEWSVPNRLYLFSRR